MRRVVPFFVLLGLVGVVWLQGRPIPAEPPASAPAEALSAGPVDFSLPTVDGQKFALADLKDKKVVVVVFLGTECPLVVLYLPRLNELAKEFAGKGVAFVGINSNPQDDVEAIKAQIGRQPVVFPMLKDSTQEVANRFNATRTPQAFVLDGNRKIVYKGRIDDQYGIGFQRPYANRRDLAEAIMDVLAGRPVSRPTTPTPGCVISREKNPDPRSSITYTNQVSRILQQHCVECHRPGQIGPFSLLTYEKVKAWSDTIKEVVLERRMPPWHPDPRYGKFSNDRSMPQKDIDTLVAWIDAGCPKGDDADLPPPRVFEDNDGWLMGKPDIVLTMPDKHKIPAYSPKGGYPYQYFLTPTNFKEDVWVQAVEARPGNRKVVHHILAFIQAPGNRAGSLARGADSIGGSLLVGTAPGDSPAIFPVGVGKKIPAGSYILWQMHYTPNGAEEWDQSSIGIRVCKEPPQFEARTRAILKRRFAIPPGADHVEVRAQSTFANDAIILSFLPHMHVRGKSMMVKAHYPDGKSEILVYVPKYDFGWQVFYRWAEPLRLPAGTRLECIGVFDNSSDNPNNPDPTKTVYWGEQTWEEMMIGWFDYYEPVPIKKVPDSKRTVTQR